MKKLLLLIGMVIALFIRGFSQMDFEVVTKNIIGAQTDFKAVAIGDVSNDGLDDLVIGSGSYGDITYDYNILIYKQNISGALDSPIRFEYPNTYPGLKVLQLADLNNDSLNDIVIGYGDNIGIYYQLNSGQFSSVSAHYSGNTVDGLKTGDLNHDGLIDIAVCHWGSNYIKIFTQNANGTFSTKMVTIQNAGYDEIDIADINGDGLDDVIYMPGQGMSSTLQILYQDPQLGITDSVFLYKYTGEYFPTLHGIGIGDLNNDGRNDIAGGIGGNGANLLLLFQDSLGKIGNNVLKIPAYDIPTPVEIADLNCDGNNEIIVGHNGWGSVTIYEKGNSAGYSNYSRYNASFYYNPYSMAIGDLNNDNKLDIVTVDNGATYSILYNHSKPDNYNIDTAIWNLNSITDTLHSTQTYQKVEVDSTEACHLAYYYSVSVDVATQRVQFVGDSAFIRNGIICGSAYIDTLISGFDYSDYQIISSDTTKDLFKVDTVMYNKEYVGSFYVNDTTDMWTDIIIDSVRLEEVSILNDTVYLEVDSVQLTQMILFIQIHQTYYEIYQGIKCGVFTIDTVLLNAYNFTDQKVLQSDSIVYFHTIEKYPLSIEESSQNSIQIYPNPVQDDVVISFDPSGAVSGTIRIYNLYGAKVLEQDYRNEKSVKLNLINLVPGFYTIQLVYRGKEIVKKIIKE